MSKKKAGRLQDCERRYTELKAQVQNLGFVVVGSLQERLLKCGKPGCACHVSAQKRHGPYYHWTRKVNAKTINVVLTADEASLFRNCIENSRTLDRIVQQMRELSSRAASLTTGRPKARFAHSAPKASRKNSP